MGGETLENIAARGDFIKLVNACFVSGGFQLTINVDLDSWDAFSFVVHYFTM